jgi:hypothetical protein
VLDSGLAKTLHARPAPDGLTTEPTIPASLSEQG